MLHQAAIPSVPRSVKDPITSNRANVDATLNVLVAARDAGVRRLVFAGSSSAYGDTPTLPKHEDMPTNPLSPYALQKVVGEQYLQMFTKLYGLETVSIRYFNVFGPRQDPIVSVLGRDLGVRDGAARESVHPRSTATGSRPATSPTSPTSSTACSRACEATGASGQVINVATGGRISLNDLFKEMKKIVGRDRRAANTSSRAQGDVRDSQADIRKAKDILGYKPTCRSKTAWSARSSGTARPSRCRSADNAGLPASAKATAGKKTRPTKTRPTGVPADRGEPAV